MKDRMVLLFYALGGRVLQARYMSLPRERMRMDVLPRKAGRSHDRLGDGLPYCRL